MKIGILTAIHTDNNGTDLQALAMLNLFSRMGASDVELIDYECVCLDSSKYLLKPFSLRKIVYYPISALMHQKHKLFRARFFKQSLERFDEESLHTVEYDKIVVGSDQIWNLAITGNDLSFFLPFTKVGLKKYSYAASIGRDDIGHWEDRYKLSEKLKQFQSISVREESAVTALSRIGVNAHFDLDPILMGQAEDWKVFTQKKVKHKYIVLYYLNPKSSAWNYAKKNAQIKELNIINISPTLRCYNGVKTKRCVGVEEWINLIANAEMIYTSSYHCLSFAILFRKPFCFVPAESSIQSNARMIDLLTRIDLSERIFSPRFNNEGEIDWEKVSDKLDNIRRKSEQYVKSIIED